jgi:histone H1/5
MGEKGTGAKPMQTKPLIEDCSLKNITKDAEGATRAQPNQVSPELRKELNVRNARVSIVGSSPHRQNMRNQAIQIQFWQDIIRQLKEDHKEHMEQMKEIRRRYYPSQTHNCSNMADVAVAHTEPPKVSETAKAAEKQKAPKTVEVLNTSKLKVPAAHPDFSEMIHAAIAALNKHNGSSRQAIVKYIMANYKVGTDQKTIDSSVKYALKNSIEKGLLKTIHNVDDKKATEAPQAAEAQKVTNTPKRAEASEAKAPKATKALKIISATADDAVAPTLTSKAAKAKSPEPPEAQKIISAIADNAIAPTATTKAIEAKVPEAIEAQEMIDPRVKATLESVIQEDPLEHSEGKDTSGFPKVVPKVNAKKATMAKKHDAIKMAKTTKKATGVTKRSTKAKKPIGANRSKREKKTTNPLKRAMAAEKVKAPKAKEEKKPKAAKPKETPAKHVRKNVNAPEMIWTKKKRKERWKHPLKEKRKERWKHPLKGKEEREMEAFIISIFK